jgi:hypothetical protein
MLPPNQIADFSSGVKEKTLREKNSRDAANRNPAKALERQTTKPRFGKKARYAAELMLYVTKVKPRPKISAQSAFFFQKRKMFFTCTFMPPA